MSIKMKINKNFTVWLMLFLVMHSIQTVGQSLEEYLQIAAEYNPKVRSAYTEFEAASMNNKDFFISAKKARINEVKRIIILIELHPSTILTRK